MARVARYYCPICLMDTDFRITGGGASRVYVCSDCCVEFVQEPQAAGEEHLASGGTVAFASTEANADDEALPGAQGLDGADTFIAESRAAADAEGAAEATEDPRTACFAEVGPEHVERVESALRNDDTAALESVVPAADEVANEVMAAPAVDPVAEVRPAGDPKLAGDSAGTVLPALGVLGPTSGGKSIYIARLIEQLSRAAIRLDEDLELFTSPFQDVGSWAELGKEILEPLRRGGWPANTPRPQSRTIDVRLRGRRPGREAGEDFCLRFLDCAGETLLTWLKNRRKAKEDPNFDPLFESEEMSRTHARIDAVMRSSRGLLLLVSPEHSPMLSGAREVGGDFAGYFFQYLFDFQKEARVKYHIAIAFTKYDRFRGILDPDNAEEFARRYFAQMNNTLQGFFDGQFRYFAISSVGHICHPLGLDGRPLVDSENPSMSADGRPAPLARPFGVETPLLWLIGRLREDGHLQLGGERRGDSAAPR